MQASDLRTYLEIHRLVKRPETTDDWSEQVDEWSTVGGLQAKIEDLAGNEREFAQQVVGIQRYRITTRFRADISICDRLYDPISDTMYNLESVANHNQQRRFLRIMATISDS